MNEYEKIQIDKNLAIICYVEVNNMNNQRANTILEKNKIKLQKLFPDTKIIVLPNTSRIEVLPKIEIKQESYNFMFIYKYEKQNGESGTGQCFKRFNNNELNIQDIYNARDYILENKVHYNVVIIDWKVLRDEDYE